MYRENQILVGKHLDQDYVGIVRSSRVKYGQDMAHTVDLFYPITVFGRVVKQIIVKESDNFCLVEKV